MITPYLCKNITLKRGKCGKIVNKRKIFSIIEKKMCLLFTNCLYLNTKKFIIYKTIYYYLQIGEQNEEILSTNRNAILCGYLFHRHHLRTTEAYE
jgi:hypothetical protein